jgi:SAM-dependent methyltransferase
MQVATMPIDYAAIKKRQQAVWSSGDYAIIGTTLQIVGEGLCEAVDMRAGNRVLDVAAGNGNATLAAARRFAHVVSTDYVEAHLRQGKERAAAERFRIDFQGADAEELPFPDGSFDVALSTFGVMFAPNQEKAAAELVRVVRRGGKVGLANWTPDGFVGRLLKIVSKYTPAPAGLKPSVLWGTSERLAELFPGHEINAAEQTFMFRYTSPEHWLHVFRTSYGPTNRAFAALEGERAVALEADILDLLERSNWGGSNSLVIPGTYLEAVITRS